MYRKPNEFICQNCNSIVTVDDQLMYEGGIQLATCTACESRYEVRIEMADMPSIVDIYPLDTYLDVYNTIDRLGNFKE